MIDKQIQPGNNELICQRWQWKERGWDSEKDGFSLHLSLEALKTYVQAYWNTMPDIRPAPEQYGCPEGSPYRVYVDDVTQLEVSLTGSARYDTSFSYPNPTPPRL